MFVNSRYQNVKNGISTKLYEGYPDLFMQFSQQPEYVHVPDWYFDVEYSKEMVRGYDFLEDLFVPGYFELNMKEGECIVFSAGTEEVNPVSLKQRFTRELKKRTRHYTSASSLRNAAGQFILHKKNKIDVIAGYPWYNSITRQTFISLPGLAHALNSPTICEQVLKTYEPFLKRGMFPDSIASNEPVYHSADAPLWYIWAVQHYTENHSSKKLTWGKFGSAIKKILEAYYNSLPYFIEVTPDGLLHAEKEKTALTWMNSYVRGIPVVQRAGLTIEINALWYNAIGFAVEMAEIAGEKEFAVYWKEMHVKVGKAFLNTFWSDGHEHLADVVRNGQADWAIRPNMVIAAAMKYSPLSTEQKKSILSVVKKKLLTKRGLRTLSPDHLRYKGIVEGNQDERESAIHQGAAWPWLMQFFVEAYLNIHHRGGLPFVKQLMEVFEEEMTEHCIGTLSEFYDGNPPYKARGATSVAWNVAGVFYAMNQVQNYKD